MSKSVKGRSNSPTADYEAAYPEGDCVRVGWTDEEMRELYAVEWEEPLHDRGFWSGVLHFLKR